MLLYRKMKLFLSLMHLYSEGDYMTGQDNFQIFKNIYDETYNNLLKFIICRCSNIDDVNDIIQEVYTEFYSVLVNERDIKDINKYIYGIAKNKIKRHYSLANRFKTISLFRESEDKEMLDNISNDIDIEKIVLNKSDIDFIWNYLKKKKIIIQRIFYLFYSLDLTIKEISNELNISESCVKNYLYRTLNELQEVMRKECE